MNQKTHKSFLSKNAIVKLKIDDINSSGFGVARAEGVVVFVPCVCVGDVCKIKIVKVQKNFCYGKLLNVISLSPFRIKSDCAVFQRCGSCALRHISYTEELRVKTKQVFDSMTKIADITSEDFYKVFEGTAGAKQQNYYRNKIQVPVSIDREGHLITGFYGINSHNIVRYEDCKIQPKIFTEIINAVLTWAKSRNISAYDEKSGHGYLRHIYLRCNADASQIMLCLVVNSNKMKKEKYLREDVLVKFPQIKSVFYNFNQKQSNIILGGHFKLFFGKPYLIDQLAGLYFMISPQAFYQVNHSQTEVLYGVVHDFVKLSKSENVLDLFCGIGTIGLTFANLVNKVLGIEIVEQAVKDARQNAKINGITNATFVRADANKIKDALAKYHFKPDTIILDPPRKGIELELVETISSTTCKNLVYVSCKASTLARDIKLFTKIGSFTLKRLKIVDLFPRTPHVESVCLLSRKEK